MKQITFILGHYGSGKSEFALNLAFNKKVKYLVDLDIVNPYFRSRELEQLFSENNQYLISSSIQNSLGSDLPYIAKEAFLPFYNIENTAIYDLGGDNVGAKIIRQFSDVMIDKNIDFLFCINVYRDNTSSVEKILEMIDKIEESSGIKITGLINNSNMLKETRYEDIKFGEKIILEVSKIKGLEILYTGIWENIINSCGPVKGEVLKLNLYLRKKWL